MGKAIHRDPLARRQTPDRFGDLATAIGYLAMDWAHLDATLDFVVEALLDITGDQQSCVTAVLPGVEQRCQLVSRLVHIDPPTSEWLTDFDEIIQVLQGVMVGKRNRYIHDAWTQNGADFHRTDKRALIKKPQAGSDKALFSRRITPVKLDDVWNLIKQVDDVGTDLWWISLEYFAWIREKRVPASNPRRSLHHTHNRPQQDRSLDAGYKLPPRPLPHWLDN